MVEAEDWERIDELWDVSLERTEVSLRSSELQSLDQAWGIRLWPEVDPWWDSYVTDRVSVLDSSTVGSLAAEGASKWNEIDSMWEPYAKRQKKQFQSLSSVFDDVNGEWMQSSSRFNQDPLIRDARRMHSPPGPLRATHEEDWSHWLASLLRNSEGEFSRRLLGEQFDTSPISVRREVRFDNPDGKTRRVDVLVEFDHGGLMIEIKIGDTNYEKTLQTAALVEKQKRGTWKHILLLPDSHSVRLDRTFDDQVIYDDGEPREIEFGSGGVRVIYWKDVSRTLRQTLISDAESDPYWESSAYVFISLIEQQICSFDLLPPKNNRALEKGTEGGELLFSDIQHFSQNNFDSQITHMERTTEENDG